MRVTITELTTDELSLAWQIHVVSFFFFLLRFVILINVCRFVCSPNLSSFIFISPHFRELVFFCSPWFPEPSVQAKQCCLGSLFFFLVCFFYGT